MSLWISVLFAAAIIYAKSTAVNLFGRCPIPDPKLETPNENSVAENEWKVLGIVPFELSEITSLIFHEMQPQKFMNCISVKFQDPNRFSMSLPHGKQRIEGHMIASDKDFLLNVALDESPRNSPTCQSNITEIVRIFSDYKLGIFVLWSCVEVSSDQDEHDQAAIVFYDTVKGKCLSRKKINQNAGEVVEKFLGNSDVGIAIKKWSSASVSCQMDDVNGFACPNPSDSSSSGKARLGIILLIIEVCSVLLTF